MLCPVRSQVESRVREIIMEKIFASIREEIYGFFFCSSFFFSQFIFTSSSLHCFIPQEDYLLIFFASFSVFNFNDFLLVKRLLLLAWRFFFFFVLRQR